MVSHKGCFGVEFGGELAAVCGAVEGLEQRRDFESVVEGGRAAPRILPGPVIQPALVLLELREVSLDLLEWVERSFSSGLPERRSGALLLFDDEGSPRLRWDFSAALCARWTAPSAPAGAAGVVFGSLVLAHEGLTLAVADVAPARSIDPRA